MAAFLGAAAPATGQTLSPPDPANVRLRLGPLWLNPTLALTNAGVDENVFNDSQEDVPDSDFTITVTPTTDFWLRLGRSWLTGNIREDLVWYQDFVGERSANTNFTAGLVVPLTRFTFTAGGTTIDTRERPGYEIDLRAERDERRLFGSVEFRTLARTLIGGRVDRRTYAFAEGELFDGRDLREELTRTLVSGALTFRHEVTPFTSVTLDVAAEQERFEFTPQRDSDSTRVEAGVRLDPLALISGSARVGFRSFRPADANVPEFTGLTSAVDVAYVLQGSTRFDLDIARDVAYSFESTQPYYVQSGISGQVAQQIYGPLDVVARVGFQRLSYQERLDVVISNPDRVDRVRSYGFGSGYRIRGNFRVGFAADHLERTSRERLRQYAGWRYGVTASYGL